MSQMKSDLPNKKSEESLSDKLLIGTMFIVFLIVMCMLPDIMR